MATVKTLFTIIDIPGYTTIKEALEECCGGKKLRQEDVDDVLAMKGVELDVSKAVVTLKSEDQSTEDLALRRVYTNTTNRMADQPYESDVKWTDSKALWQVKTSGWSTSGGVGVAYQGAQGGVSATYHKGKLDAESKKKSRAVTIRYKENIVMEPYSSCEVTVVREETTYTAHIEGLLLKFPKDARIKTGKFQKKKLLSNIFYEAQKLVSEPNYGDNCFTAQINGKFEAKNLTAEVKKFPVNKINDNGQCHVTYNIL